MDETNYDPELLKILVQLSSAPERQKLLETRMQMGRADSQTASPQGYHVGGTYMAASPWEHLASALKQGMGMYQQRQAMSGIEGLIGQQQQGRSAYADALMKALSQPRIETYTNPTPGTGGEF